MLNGRLRSAVMVAGLGLGWTLMAPQAATAQCTYDVYPSSVDDVDDGGDSGSLSVGWSHPPLPFDVDPLCGDSWFAVSNDPWISTRTSDTDNFTLYYTVAANPTTTARTGTITVSGHATFTIDQLAAPPCPPSPRVSSTSLSFTSAGGMQTVDVQEAAHCRYGVRGNPTWIGVRPANVAGDGSVTVTVDPNTGSSTLSGTVTIGGTTVPVDVPPPACTFQVEYTSREVADDAGQYDVSVTASAATCRWSMTSHAGWLDVRTPNRTGSTHGTYRTRDNIGSPERIGTMTVAGHTVTITQRGSEPPPPPPPPPPPNGCPNAPAVQPESVSLASAAEQSDQVTLQQAETCRYAVTETLDWLRVSPSTVAGNGVVTLTTETANDMASARSGTVTIGSATITVSQCPASPTRVTHSSPVRVPDTGRTFVIGVPYPSDCRWPVADDQDWITPNRSTIAGYEKVPITVQPNDGATRSGTVRFGELTVSIVQEPLSRLSEKRDELLQDWASRTGNANDVCRGWDNLNSSAKEVFIWNTHRLHLVDMGDSSTMLDHVDRLYAIYGKDGGECGGIEYNRTFMSMTTNGMTSDLQDKLVRVDFGDDEILRPWRQSRDHSCRWYNILALGECVHTPFHDSVETEITIDGQDKEPGAQLHFFGQRDVVYVRRYFFDGQVACGVDERFAPRSEVCTAGNCYTITGPSPCPLQPRYQDMILSDPIASYTRGPRNSQQYNRVTITDAYSFEMDQDYGGRNRSAPSCLHGGVPMREIYSQNYGNPRWNWQPPACHDRLSSKFSDDALPSDVTQVRAVHVTELRDRINAVRILFGLTPFAWTDAIITPGSTPIKALHLTELRRALAEAYTVANRDTPTYTDTTIVAGRTAIRSVHLRELRLAVLALEE